tara:strand:+ start:138 stop:347 length:210 start_codon:yes stop_codon:yes gene_type:complete
VIERPHLQDAVIEPGMAGTDVAIGSDQDQTAVAVERRERPFDPPNQPAAEETIAQPDRFAAIGLHFAAA